MSVILNHLSASSSPSLEQRAGGEGGWGGGVTISWWHPRGPSGVINVLSHYVVGTVDTQCHNHQYTGIHNQFIDL